MRILVVEDEPLIALSMDVALEHAGHEVIGPVPCGSRALRLAEDKRPDLALIDIILGAGDNGIEVARRLLRRFGTPTLLVSGAPGDARNAQNAALGLVEKPYPQMSLLKAVEVAQTLIDGGEPQHIPHRLELFPDGISRFRQFG